jgi:hypothetical protein
VFKRRKIDRRAGEQRDESRADAGRRASDRRKQDRRCSYRLAYPIGAAPEIINIRSQVVGLSLNAVRFFVVDFNPQKSSLDKGGKIKLSLKFHDGQVIETVGTISRQELYQAGREYFICLLDEKLPQERLDKERQYLIEKFPDFCRDSFDP